MIVTMHPLMDMLQTVQQELRLTDRAFAIDYLKITEDTYSNWKRQFPSRLTKKSLNGISETLGLSADEILELL